MEHTLKVAIIQTHLFWENPVQNRFNIENKLRKLSANVDLVVLPELFSTGFTMHPEKVAESMQGETVKWMQKMASELNFALTGSAVIAENDNYYNRLLFVHPEGKITIYDKRHSFTLAGEHKIYTSGTKKLIVDYKGWKICPLICYDLRFPVWARNVEDYDLLFYVANWPKKRINAWQNLLKARAIENMSYTIGVNRIGLDGNGYEHSGHSKIFDCMGSNVIEIESNKEQIIEVTLDKNYQNKQRQKLQFLNDRDDFQLL